MIFGRFIESGPGTQAVPASSAAPVEGRPRPQIPPSAAAAGK
jgi:hypothetical protein